MMSNPRPGEVVQVWYRASMRDRMPLHGKCGGVIIAPRGRSQKCEVQIDGMFYVIAYGNLRRGP